MNEGHYCSKHDVTFFKKGKMRGYAHPLQDDEGNDTREWCNEDTPPEVAEPSSKPVQSATDPPKPKIGGDVRRDCKSFCLSYSKDLVASKDIPLPDIITYANQFYKWMIEDLDAKEVTANLKVIEGKPK